MAVMIEEFTSLSSIALLGAYTLTLPLRSKDMIKSFIVSS